MAQVFDFGIGISIDSGEAVASISGVIQHFSSLEDQMKNLDSIAGATIGNTFQELDGVGASASASAESITEISVELDAACGAAACVGAAVEDVTTDLMEAEEATESWAKTLGRGARALTDIGTSVLNAGLSELEHQTVRLTARFGQSYKEAQTLAHNVLDLANETKVAHEEVADLTLQLGVAGMTMEQVEAQGAGSAQALVHMSSTFGVGAEAAQRFAGAAGVMGSSVNDLMGQAVIFEKRWGVPGLVNELPAAAETARKAQARFGRQVSGDARRVTSNITRMSAAYAKALGKTAAEAAHAAREAFGKFTGEVSSFEDVFLGLADDFSPLQNALFEAGLGLDEVNNLMVMGQEDPVKFAERARSLIDSIGDPILRRRVEKQILGNIDASTAELLSNREALEKAVTQGAELAVDEPPTSAEAEEAIKNVTDAMRNNAIDAKKMFDAMTGIAVEMGKLQIAPGVRDGLMGMTNLLQDANRELIKLSRGFATMEGPPRTLFDGVISGGTIFAVVVGGIITAVGALSNAWRGLTTIFKGFRAVLSPIWRGFTGLVNRAFPRLSAFLGRISAPFSRFLGFFTQGASLGSRLGGALRVLGGIIGKVALPLGVLLAAWTPVKTAFNEISDILNSNMSGWEMFKEVLGSVFKAVWSTVDNFFLGIPSRIAEFFGMKGDIGAAVAEIGVWFGEVVGDMFDAVFSAENWNWDATLDLMKDAFFGTINLVKDAWTGFVTVITGDMEGLKAAWQELKGIVGMDDEAAEAEAAQERQNALTGRAMAERDKNRAVDVIAADLLRGDLTGTRTQDLDFMMQDIQATETAEQKAARDAQVEHFRSIGFEGASDEVLQRAALMRAMQLKEAQEEGGGQLDTAFISRVQRGEDLFPEPEQAQAPAVTAPRGGFEAGEVADRAGSDAARATIEGRQGGPGGGGLAGETGDRTVTHKLVVETGSARGKLEEGVNEMLESASISSVDGESR